MHIEVLSPLSHPWAYTGWLLDRGALLVAAVVCFKFYGATRRSWWLVPGSSFALLLAFYFLDPWRAGAPWLPYAEVSEPVSGPPAPDGMATGQTVYSRTYTRWEPATYLLAITLWLAWQQYRARESR